MELNGDVSLFHDADGFAEGDDDAVVVVDVLGREDAAALMATIKTKARFFRILCPR